MEVKIKKRKMYLEDGHHRYLTAKKLRKSKILAEVTIDDNPIEVIRGLGKKMKLAS